MNQWGTLGITFSFPYPPTLMLANPVFTEFLNSAKTGQQSVTLKSRIEDDHGPAGRLHLKMALLVQGWSPTKYLPRLG